MFSTHVVHAPVDESMLHAEAFVDQEKLVRRNLGGDLRKGAETLQLLKVPSSIHSIALAVSIFSSSNSV